MHHDFFFYPPTSFIYDVAPQIITHQVSSTPPVITVGPAPSSSLRQLLLLPELQSVYIAGHTDGFRLRFTAANPMNVDPHVFLYIAKPLVPGSPDFDAKFQKVCSPSDLEESPASAPWPTFNPPYYRLDFVELDFHTRAEALSVRAAIISDVFQLLTSLDAMDSLASDQPILIQGN